MRMLVIASVPPSTKISPENPRVQALLRIAGLQTPTFDLDREAEYVEALRPYFVRKARDMFSGHFKHVLRFVNALRALGHEVDLKILSPRYGLLDEDSPVIPHIASLRNMSMSSIRKLADSLKTFESFIRAVRSKNYDIVVLVLNREDIFLIHDPKAGRDLSIASSYWGKLIVISASSVKKLLERIPKSTFYSAKNVGERLERLEGYMSSLAQLKLPVA